MERGLIVKTTGSRHNVLTDDRQIIPCTIKGKLKIRGIRSTNPVTVGDRVEFFRLENENAGIITAILERKNYIIRRSSNLSRESHVIAANLDQALLVVTLARPKTTLRFIDRFLATAEAYRIQAVLIFNKTDIYNQELLDEMAQLRGMYSETGYRSVETSVPEKRGLEEMKEMMKDKISLLAGNSGVGKSSIINAIDPSLNLKTMPVSQLHKTGRHTTTFSEMHELVSGGFIIDTPGIKAFGIIDMDREEIFHFFPEIFRLSEHCKYYNCMHINEPGCEVKKALETGKLGKSRYESYLSLYFEDKGKYRTTRY